MSGPALPNFGPVPLAAVKSAASLIERDAARIYVALAGHRFGDAAVITTEDLATILADAGVPYAGIIKSLIPLVLYAAAHPAPVESPAMEKAAGADNIPGV